MKYIIEVVLSIKEVKTKDENIIKNEIQITS